MRLTLRSALVFAFFLILFSACSPGEGGKQANKPDYKETKQMLVDIMQTEDGKKAVVDILKDPKYQEQILVSEQSIRSTIEKTINEPKNKKKLVEIMKDPKFAAELGKTLKEQNKKLLKDLMKDPEYQKMLIDVMKDPEFEKQLLETMKSSAYRQQMMTVMKDALESPMFQLEMMKLMEKAQKEAAKPKKQKKGQDQGGGGGGSS